MLTTSLPDISIALRRATKSRPQETTITIKLMNDTVKVYSSDEVLIAYVTIEKEQLNIRPLKPLGSPGGN